MFEIFSYRQLSNKELYALVKSILSIIGGTDAEALNLKVWVRNLKTAFDKLELAIGADRGSDLTQKIAEADDARDLAFRALKTYVEACLLRSKPEWEEAASMLWRLLENHGLNLHQESYANQTALWDKLIQEVKKNPGIQKGITTLNAQEWIEDTQKSQDNFTMLWEQRRQKQASKPEADTGEARREIRQYSRDLFRFIELMYQSTGNEDYLELIENINEEIGKMRTVVKARSTRRERQKEQVG